MTSSISPDALILGIESSCDETSCAVVEGGRDVRANVVASQIDLHARYGGVVPEIASRAHIEAINSVIDRAMEEACVSPDRLSGVAVTHEPGLIGSLLIGLVAAKTLAWAWDLPLVGVNHVYAHAYAPALDDEPIDYPAVALICSGGHTALYRCDSPIEMDLLGATIDDAAGEAFDKVATILELGYPGGPAVDRAARQGDPQAVAFPRSLLKGQSLDFSFSGIKTAVLYHVNGPPTPPKRDGKRLPPQPRGLEHMTPEDVADTAASFQSAVVDTLRIKMRRAVRATGAHTIVLGGGVSANSALRAASEALADSLGCTLRLAPLTYCTDNAAMIAGLGYHLLNAGVAHDLDLPANATVRR
jgi:N6-L-threonylcarbamoyladenine synthase